MFFIWRNKSVILLQLWSFYKFAVAAQLWLHITLDDAKVQAPQFSFSGQFFTFLRIASKKNSKLQKSFK